MKRVLVTGASGFIGKPSVKALLERGFEVVAISSRPNNQAIPGVVWYQADLHDASAISQIMQTVKPGALLHLAWYVEHGKYWSSPENLRWVKSSLDLAQEFVKNGGTRFVGAGTCAEYDWSQVRLVETEDGKNPSTLYGASKSGLQSILSGFAKSTDTGFAWGRIFFPFGPNDGEKRLIPQAMQTLLRNEVFVCNNPTIERDFIFVRDVAEIFARLVDSDTFGPVNIGNGVAVRVENVISLIARHLDRDELVKFGNAANSNEPPSFYADIKKLGSVMESWTPTKIEDGLNETIQWWKKRAPSQFVTK